MIFNFKHLQTHPNRLIAWALIYGSVLDLQTTNLQVIHEYFSDSADPNHWTSFKGNLLKWSVPNYIITQKDPEWIQGMLFASNQMLYELFYLLLIGINFGIIWDFYRTIYNPFESTARRHRIIMKVSPILFIGLQLFNSFFIWRHRIYGMQKKYIGPLNYMYYRDKRYNFQQLPIEGTLMLTLIFCSIASCIYAYRSLLNR